MSPGKSFGELFGAPGPLWGAFSGLWPAFRVPGEPFQGGFGWISTLCSASEMNFGKAVGKLHVFSPPTPCTVPRKVSLAENVEVFPFYPGSAAVGRSPCQSADPGVRRAGFGGEGVTY